MNNIDTNQLYESVKRHKLVYGLDEKTLHDFIVMIDMYENYPTAFNAEVLTNLHDRIVDGGDNK